MEEINSPHHGQDFSLDMYRSLIFLIPPKVMGKTFHSTCIDPLSFSSPQKLRISAVEFHLVEVVRLSDITMKGAPEETDAVMFELMLPWFSHHAGGM